MAVRAPAVAGRFYDASPQDCLRHLQQLISSPEDLPDLSCEVLAGVVPHAGWTFSGNLAAKVFAAAQQNNHIDTFVLTGSIHVVRTDFALVYDTGQWETPLGCIDIDETGRLGGANGQKYIAKTVNRQRQHRMRDIRRQQRANAVGLEEPTHDVRLDVRLRPEDDDELHQAH